LLSRTEQSSLPLAEDVIFSDNSCFCFFLSQLTLLKLPQFSKLVKARAFRVDLQSFMKSQGKINWLKLDICGNLKLAERSCCLLKTDDWNLRNYWSVFQFSQSLTSKIFQQKGSQKTIGRYWSMIFPIIDICFVH